MHVTINQSMCWLMFYQGPFPIAKIINCKTKVINKYGKMIGMIKALYSDILASQIWPPVLSSGSINNASI